MDFDLNEYLTEFSRDVLSMFVSYGFAFFDNNTVNSSAFCDGLDGFIQHRILTNNNNDNFAIYINRQTPDSETNSCLSDALRYSLLCAGIDDYNSEFKNKYFEPMQCNVAGIMLEDHKKKYIDGFQYWQEITDCDEDDLSETDPISLACDIQNARLLGEDISLESLDYYARLLEIFNDSYSKDSIAGRILNEVINGKFKDVIFDFAMISALIELTYLDIDTRELQKTYGTVPFTPLHKDALDDTKRWIKASSIVNPDVNDVLLSYYHEMRGIINDADKSLAVIETKIPSYNSNDDTDWDSFFNPYENQIVTSEQVVVLGKILPFKANNKNIDGDK